MTFDDIRKHVEAGLVKMQQHPSMPSLRIFNYAERVQYEKLWDDITMQCRGLVMMDDKIVARPFRKFFNDTEHADGEVPWHLPCEVTEKLDGSLLIVWNVGGVWMTATRGSFLSQQAKEGYRILFSRYRDVALVPGITYLFEVIYPANRIVVDYGSREDVVLLGMIETETGRELPLDDAPAGLTVVRRLPMTDNARELRNIIRDDEEGYVVRFENGFRVKVKGVRYMELHRILSGVSSRSVWESLSTGKPFDELLAVVPDEFADWVRAEKAALETMHAEHMSRAYQALAIAKQRQTRKEQALAILEHFKDVSSLAFLLLDGKPCEAQAWKMLYPEFRRPENLYELST